MKKALIPVFVILLVAVLGPWPVLAGSDPPPPTGFKLRPSLQCVTQNTVGVMWQTHNASTGTIRISTNYNMTPSVTHNFSTSTTRHKVTLSGLTPNTVYYYQVTGDGETSPKGSFVTALPKGSTLPFRFAVYGDTRLATWYEDIVAKYGDNDDHLPVCTSLASYSPDFILHVGDLVQDGNDTDAILNFFDVEKELLAKNPVAPTYGNHEFSGGYGTGNTKVDSYLVPKPGSPNFAYYSYVYGNIKILVLNTGPGVWPDDNFDLLAQGSAQWNWLYNEVSAAASDTQISHIFISMHAPPFSCANFGDNHKLYNALEPITHLTPKLKMVFMGHEHDYQHMEYNGVHYVLAGGGGSPILDLLWKGDDNDTDAHLIKYDDVLNYVIVDVQGEDIRVEARKVQGNGNTASSVIEVFTLTFNPLV